MTRPIFEPSTSRTEARLGFGNNQLFRRPAPVSPGTAIYEIKVFADNALLTTGDDAFVWEIPEDLDNAAVVKVEAYISTAGASAVTVQIRASDPCDTGADILSTPITIDAGECNSKDAAVQPVVIDPTVVAWGDHLHIDIDAAGGGARGLGVIVTLAPAALAAVVLAGAQGAQGPPGGIVAWMGAWSSATSYVTNDAVSNNGSSYVAINNNTNVEPGVDAGWETDWMLLAEGGAGSTLQIYAGDFTASDFTFDSTSYVASGYPTNSTFTKISSTSILEVAFAADFTTNATAPNAVFCGFFIDGSNELAVCSHVSLASYFMTLTGSCRRGAGNSSGSPWAAGAHTIELKVAHAVGGSNTTLRSAAAVELTIVEFEP